jgi:aquaporin related protein
MLQMPDKFRNNLLCVFGEFVGTFMFLLFSFAGTQVSNTPMAPDGSPPNTSNLLYTSLCFGFSLTVNVWAFFRVTGGLFNPAVTLALCVTGGMPPLRGLMVFPAQLVAGIAAAGVVSAMFPGAPNFKTRLGGGASISQGLFIEMFLTAQLVLVIIMLAVVKHKSTYLAPVGIGLAFFLCELVGMYLYLVAPISHKLTIFKGDYYTGGSLNPARSLGPDVINRQFPGYHWIYWVGPLLGSLLASGFYHLLCWVRWETINPGQDYDEWETKRRNDSLLSENTMTDHANGSYDQASPGATRTQNTYQPPIAHDYSDTPNGTALNQNNQTTPRIEVSPEHQV